MAPLEPPLTAIPERMLRILQLNPVPTPFRMEFAKRLLELDEVSCSHVYFPFSLPSTRGRHWASSLDPSLCFTGIPDDGTGLEYRVLERLVTEGRYNVVLSSLSLSCVRSLQLLSVVRKSGISVIHWAEQPMPCNILKRTFKDQMYRWRFRKVEPLAIFAIGDRAAERYRRLTSASVFLVPYYQDLSACLEKPLLAALPEIQFLFSGQLIARNNIRAIVAAGDDLQRRGIQGFHILFFGDGPERRFVETAAAQRSFVSLQAEAPKTWNARLTPIDQSHILLSPGLHSGWGLTIPEALAAGRPVISTSLVESARYYVRDGINGFLCDPSPTAIAARMQIFVQRPGLIAEMELACRCSAQFGDAAQGAKVVVRLLEHLLF